MKKTLLLLCSTSLISTSSASIVTYTFNNTTGDLTDTSTLKYENSSTGNNNVQKERLGLQLSFDYTPVPEPSSTALLGLGGLALILRRRK